MIYEFIDQKGTFKVKHPHKISYLYFPLTNKEGTLLSSITPYLSGDIKKDNERFLTLPTTVEDLNNNLLCRREFFLKINNEDIFRLSEPTEDDILEAGILYHKMIKQLRALSIEITNFIPHNREVEIMWIRIKNNGNVSVQIIPTSFLYIFGRGEKNLRDHRHVSSLLNRVRLHKYGIVITPTMVFDEKGHKINRTSYFVMGYQDNFISPTGQYPTLLYFLGEGGTLSAPAAVYNNIKPIRKKLNEFDGKENCAALRFKTIKLKPKSQVNYILIMGITDNVNKIQTIIRELNSVRKIDRSLNKTINYWENVSKALDFDFGNYEFNNWLKWVKLQPILRKLFGCSFLPHFDYGKGGRGWRDLWQDILSLLLINLQEARKMITKNIQGVRIDGSNATIITKNGNFISDRNKISRVWMDHGIWPFLTIKSYLDYTGDINILLKETTYFRDHQLMRAKEIDPNFEQKDYLLRDHNKKIYKGSILEHILLENLVPFFNVGTHNIIKLENADWNDGLDMAAHNGESVTFTCMYGYNLYYLTRYLKELKKQHNNEIYIFSELLFLLDTIKNPVDYYSYKDKQTRLKQYLEKTKYGIEGKKINVHIDKIITDLNRKYHFIFSYIRNNEFLKYGFYNGYYDNKRKRVEGKRNGKIRIMLPSQVFSIMSGVATDKQIKSILKNINKYLRDVKLGGIRLNSNFGTLYPELGRAFSFSYGDKENGAFFNHMNILLAFSLYERNFIYEAWNVLESIYRMSTAPSAKIYPNIPEYFNSQGRGLYQYLTGSATWYIYTIFSQILGIRGENNRLIINPKLLTQNFYTERIKTEFYWKKIPVTINYLLKDKTRKKNMACMVEKAYIGDRLLNIEEGKIIITRKILLRKRDENIITLILSANNKNCP